VLDNLIEGIISTTILEWIAVCSSIIYVILAAKKLIYCWLFAFISSALYVYICFTANLYLESVLQLFYVVMAIVGFLLWNRSNSGQIIKWPVKYHVINLTLSTITALVLGYLFSRFTDQASPYIDASTTIFSLAATFMVTKKVLENWIYWIIIDAISVYLYFSRDLHLTAVLFLVFTILAIAGYMSWNRTYKSELE
jgi:nicotinamide mononucleotide transporter